MSKYIKKDENGFYVFDEIEFSKTLPTGLEYFAVDKETKQIYNLGFNYKEKMEKKIADLEAKLAEYEKFMKDNEWNSIEEMQQTLNKCEERNFNLQLQLISMGEQCKECKHLNKKIELNIKNKLLIENEQLKQQLADMEQEYKELKNKLHIAEQETLHFQNKYFAEKQIAIEELEKVKETTECVLDNALKNSSLNQSYYDRLLDEINNQIKQLTHQREDKGE